MSGQRSDELGLGENEMVIDRGQLDRLHDDLYALTCAIEDTEHDLAASEERTVNELEAAIGWLLAAAKPVSEHQLGANAHNRRYVN